MKNVAIIGGGVAGLTLAYRLLKSNHKVTIYERNSDVGGQLYAFPVQGEMTEIYYHHTFISDTNFISLCEEIGIGDKLQWLESSMAYYTQGKQFPFGTPLDLIKFSPLSFLDKIKFGLSIIHLQNIKDITAVEKFGAKEWFYKNGYSQVWNVIWEPLFRLKFAELADEISLVWLWDKLIKRGKSRNSGKEKLCYMHGSFFELAKELKAKIIEMGGRIEVNTEISCIKRTQENFEVVTENAGNTRFDVVTSTLSTKNHEKIFQTGTNSINDFDYQAAICALIVMKKPFSEYYWTNIGDFDLPFGGIIEHTNFVGTDRYKGNSIVYISRYLDSNSDFYNLPKDEILNEFKLGLSKVNPNFDQGDIIESFVFKQPDAQPIVKKGYVPPNLETSVSNLYWISTHHVYPHDRGIEYGIETANKVADLINRSQIS